MSVVLIFFFFQAEDGIRDTSVTGVQTCALPISAGLRRSARHRDAAPVPARGCPPGIPSWFPDSVCACVHQTSEHRSEERRVGKECRNGWLRYEWKTERRS